MAPKKVPHNPNSEMAQAIHHLELKVVEGFTKLSGIVEPLANAHNDIKKEFETYKKETDAKLQTMRDNQIRFRLTSKYAGVIILAVMGAIASDLIGIIQKGLSQ